MRRINPVGLRVGGASSYVFIHSAWEQQPANENTPDESSYIIHTTSYTVKNMYHFVHEIGAHMGALTRQIYRNIHQYVANENTRDELSQTSLQNPKISSPMTKKKTRERPSLCNFVTCTILRMCFVHCTRSRRPCGSLYKRDLPQQPPVCV